MKLNLNCNTHIANKQLHFVYILCSILQFILAYTAKCKYRKPLIVLIKIFQLFEFEKLAKLIIQDTLDYIALKIKFLCYFKSESYLQICNFFPPFTNY